MKNRTSLLALDEIAAWQVAYPPAKQGKLIAELPALQRGAVWKVKQIEELWDSILRGFPIGAFVVSPVDSSLLRQNFKYDNYKTRPTASHHLLDGQQRATAIALAFDDIWTRLDEEAKGALWIDLAPPEGAQELSFVFRVLTRAHPWGYRKSNPDETLSVNAIRTALAAYREAIASPECRPEALKLHQTWPWDANAPIPVALLVKALTAFPNDINAAIKALWNDLKALPLITPKTLNHEGATVEGSHEKQVIELRKNLDEAHNSAGSVWHTRLAEVLKIFAETLFGESRYTLPAVTLNIAAHHKDANHNSAKDAIELLFIRINSRGTPLAGEELIYSLIKAEWPDVAAWMQQLPNRPALPSRVAALCVRLVLARHSKHTSGQVSMPAVPGVDEFRRLLRDDDFKERLKDFINEEARSLFETAWDFLVLPANQSPRHNEDFRLLPAQAVDIAQHSQDVFFLLLRWLDRLQISRIDVAQIDKKIWRRTLGFITAIAWFAKDKTKACASIWAEIESDVDGKKLLERFNSTRFRIACRISERHTLQMIPLPTPDDLEKACARFIVNDGRYKQTVDKATIHFPDSIFWNDRNWWYEQFNPTLANDIRRDWQARMERVIGPDQDSPEYTSLVDQAVMHFLDTLWGAKNSILLYAQRPWLRHWFPNFDPSQPEMLEDKNRPWDIDHILPQRYFGDVRPIGTSVRDWGNSIGNLRAWPLEANRADGDSTPLSKLGFVSGEEIRYGVAHDKDERMASFVDEELDWPYWKKAVPVADEEGKEVTQHRYLSNSPQKVDENRIATVTAIVLRFGALYRHWYNSLRLDDLQ